ncbi:MAG: T9SS type A sorting domain-containing protein [Sphingobacteriales bacterium]|nr:MAG: T9SS type A sorting domain-containing protein [Sphingobacteriales bacterium]
MKRIYLLLLLCIGVAGSVSAQQRKADLQVTLQTPTASTVLQPGGTFDALMVVKNLGPDSVKVSDSIFYYWTLQGKIVSFAQSGGGSANLFWRWGRKLMSGDTMHIRVSGIKPNYTSQADSQRAWCGVAYPFRKTAADSIKDYTMTNNNGCATFTWKANPTGIDDASITFGNTNTAEVFPNPAQNAVSFGLNMQYTGDVTIRIMDMTGRVILTENRKNLETGKHNIPFNTEHLANGLYLYNVQMGNQATAGKLMIAK